MRLAYIYHQVCWASSFLDHLTSIRAQGDKHKSGVPQSLSSFPQIHLKKFSYFPKCPRSTSSSNYLCYFSNYRGGLTHPSFSSILEVNQGGAILENNENLGAFGEGLKKNMRGYLRVSHYFLVGHCKAKQMTKFQEFCECILQPKIWRGCRTILVMLL